MPSVSKAFYVSASEQQINVVNENIARLEKSLKDASAQYDVGIADKTDFVIPILFVLITKLSYGKKAKVMRRTTQKEDEMDKRILDERLG